MTVEQDKTTILSSIENIYSKVTVPIVVCDQKINAIWKNLKAKEIFNKINLDLILSEENFNNIKNLIDQNKHGMIDACFLPFLGCKINVIPVRHNSFSGAILMFQIFDKTDKESILKQTDNMVSILSSNLRLPMHLITNAVEILNLDIDKFESSDFDKKKIKRSISVVENNTYKMYRVCKNLSELIKFSTGSNYLNKSIVKISDYINNLISNCSDYIKLAGLNVVYNFSSLSDAVNLMLIDCEKIDLAISNIILNSCQYSFKNKNIFINVTVSKYLLTVVIQDEGFGIPKDKLSDIFRPYMILKNKHYVNRGLGIGLTLAKYIINQHDGSIEIDSEEDVGTTVTIKIPIVCDIESNIIQIYSRSGFKSKMSTVAIQFSPLVY
ncbi:MAG: hypothetical protein J6C55_00665 [Oscillospiraceae bacterium]|nr:hypothetical protein [Oscillospiraceae bacterium]